jgi:twitching motility two-component system response regulator PilG
VPKKKGYEVRGVTGGQAALDALAEEPPDLVLLAIMLPELDGFEVCRLIKSEMSTKHIPVIMLTAKKTLKDMERGQEVCVDGYITKPFKPAMVIEAIQKFLNK